MTQVTVTLSKELDRIVGVVKSIYGFSSKNKAIQFIIREAGQEIFERELNPKFVKKIKLLEKEGKFKEYNSWRDIKRELNA